MEAERRSSKRKPLFDCTNTLQNRDKNPSKTLIKPPKKPSKNVNNKLNFPISSPSKSLTSTGSNSSSNSLTHVVPSISRFLDSSAPSVNPIYDGDCRNYRVTVDQVQRHETNRKDKGKMVAENPIIQLSASLITSTNSLQVSSSTSPGHSSHSEMQVVQNQDIHVQIMKDKGKITENAPVIQSPSLSTSKFLDVYSSSGCSISETSPVQSQKVDDERRLAKGKLILETPNIEVFEPSTPHAPIVSFADSGTLDRPLMDYNRRRSQRVRKHAANKINLPLSCPPDQRSKKTGLELNSERGVNKSGPHTDPLPDRKKKRSDDEYEMHVMSKEEVEKLKTYFADIDAFELPVEEVASENELE